MRTLYDLDYLDNARRVLLTLEQTVALSNLTSAQVIAWGRQCCFPQPIQLADSTQRWAEHEVLAWQHMRAKRAETKRGKHKSNRPQEAGS